MNTYIMIFIIIMIIISICVAINIKSGVKKEGFTQTRYTYIDIENNEDEINCEFEKTDIKMNIEKYIENFEGNITENENENFEKTGIELLPKTKVERNVWTYWENIKNKTPSYINLCFKTMKKHYAKYNFRILDNKTIHKYLKNIPDLSHLMIAQKVDYYRIALLYNYGGIWIDADTIAMKNLDEIFEKLDDGYDYVGFGCTGNKCINGYPKPSNGVMGSRKHGILMKCCLNKLDKKINKNKKKHGYFDLGKHIIWKCLKNLKNYDYYHFPSEYDGSRDSEGKWIHSPNHLSMKHTKLLNENKAIFIFLANYELMNNKDNEWFINLDEEQIMNDNMWISYLFNKTLKS